MRPSVMIVVMVATLYRHVEPTGLWLWALAVVAITLARHLVINLYQRKLVGAGWATPIIKGFASASLFQAQFPRQNL